MPLGHALSVIPNLSQSHTGTSYNMRRERIKGVSADHLLPVLLYLIQVVGEGASVRQELEEGYKQAKEVRATYLRVTREETERWATERAELIEEKPGAETETKENTVAWKAKASLYMSICTSKNSLEQFRNAETEHKAIVAHIQNSHKPEIDSCASRFMSLGRDSDGRIYYALSASGPQRGKKERLPTESEQLAMKRWGWFIAVYGKPGTVIQHGSDAMDEDEDEDEPSEERWWGFADVKEMRKLSKWLAYCAEADISTDIGDTKPIKSSAEIKTSNTMTCLMPSRLGTSVISSFDSRLPLSLMSHLSNSQSENKFLDQDHDRTFMKPTTSTEMKGLAKAVVEFANFIEWRLSRGETARGKGVIQ